MKLSQPLQTNTNENINGALLEKVILGGDVSSLSPIEKVQYVKAICSSLGLNPLTKPIHLMRLQGKEVPYFSKDASEQLRKINKVSITKLETQVHAETGVYVVTAYAVLPDGRQDSSTAAVSISGLKGDLLGNAFMKAETKAKRRVTLSICGLGFIDESEVDSIPGAQKVEIAPVYPVEVKQEVKAIAKEEFYNIEEGSPLHMEYRAFLMDIDSCETMEDLKQLFSQVLSSEVKKVPQYIEDLIKAKDSQKENIESRQSAIDIDQETGEVI